MAVLAGLVLGLLVLAGCLMTPKARRTTDSGEPIVRVRLLSAQDSVTLVVDGRPQIINASSAGDADIASSDGIVSVNGKRYRGTVRVVEAQNQKVDVINHVAVEDYLKGVIPQEMPTGWQPDALKTQAVAARTYALYEVRSRLDSSRPFDLFPDDRSQVYGGVDVEKPSSNRAVEQTRGVVLAHGPAGRERIFKAYFSSTCGGVSQNANAVFGDDDIAPLSVRVDDACNISPRYRWAEVVMTKSEITRRLRAWGTRENNPVKSIGTVRNIQFERADEGRPQRFLLGDDKNLRYTLGAEQLRFALNTDRGDSPALFSSFFVPVDAGNSIRLTQGRGWGHGVGMCQWGARGKASSGKNYKQILLENYPGSILVRAY